MHAYPFVRVSSVAACYFQIIFFSRTGSRNSLSFKLDYKGNVYKLSAKRFLEICGWASVAYYWLMVVLNII